jgi:superfamily I DNA and RNA helicase
MKRIKVKTIINSDISNIEKSKDIEFTINDKKINLDIYQKKIVYADIDKNLRIIACAGSGKTTTILCKIKYMIDILNVNPKKILLTTFNRDAALILKTRLKYLLKKDPEVRIGTFDSIAAHFYFKYFKTDGCELSVDNSKSNNMSKTNYFGCELSTDANLKSNYFGYVGVNEYSNLLLNYLNSVDKKNILDLYDYIFFDEFQDINNIQFEIIKKFTDNGSKIIAIGDDAQNIYQWRGSNIGYILNFDTFFVNTKTFKLENNYRSTPEIINLASGIIKNNSDQIDKNMLPNNPSGKKPIIIKYKNQTEQSLDIIDKIHKLTKQNIKLDEIVVISRNNFGLKIFEEQLELYNRDNDEKKRIEYIALISDNDKNATKDYNNKLCLATIHKIKGCEWSYVFLIDLDDKIFPADCDDIGIQEERRLLYVAVTRAKHYLQMSFQSNNISRFIGEIDKDLYDFPNFKNIYFNINNQRSYQIKTKVTELIQLLNNEDYEYMRLNNIIPIFNPKEEQIHTNNIYNKEILDNNLQSDYGIYIDTYISRMFGLLNNKSNGLENIIAKCTIYSLELNNYLYNIYLESKLSLHLIQYENDIIYKFEDIYSNVDKKKLEFIEDIIQRIINKAKKLNVNPSNIYVTKIGFLPDEFNNIMVESYNNFISTKEIENKDIYNISLCHNVYLNRKRLLYRDCFDMFDKNKKIYDDISIFCNKYCINKLEIKKIITDKNRAIIGELDMYDYVNKKIIDFKTSLSKQIQIEWVLQLLTYASLIRLKAKLQVDVISIYNPISGIEYNIDIKKWNKENELLDLLVKVRTQKENKNKNVNKNVNVIKPDTIIKKDKKDKKINDILLDELDEELLEEYSKINKSTK